MKKLLNKCPICGSCLKYHALMQYTNVYKVKKNGELSKNMIIKIDNGSMEAGFLICSNDDCDFQTDCDLDSINHRNISIYCDGNKYFYETDDD